ncbi:MAG TPA: undecaprenyl-diphosphate phosphatase [Steroidobacteraceae bacterium]|jgi:undecaprenyl-diphosphatase|nr:undecaprenyl-diphosphate phosphatase [Steroidobacteraceae bacterium]
MSLINILILGVVQGLAELLPVSSSAHVVVVEKLLGLDPASPPLTLLLVMLHTGTMFAVIVYFWRSWRDSYFRSAAAFKSFLAAVVLATVLTGLIYEIVYLVIEHTLLAGVPHAQIEDLFGHLEYIAPALAVGGVLILVAGLAERRGGKREAAGQDAAAGSVPQTTGLSAREAGIIGAVQGLSLPFRGLSRSGATISTGMLLGAGKLRVEIFSFALAVVLTPAVVAREALRLWQHTAPADHQALSGIAVQTLFGALVSFVAGLVALRWLSRWLERGQWYLFGLYCLLAAAVVGALHFRFGF